MVHWVYVLECEEDIIYVGETINLHTRFIEHLTGKGGATTSKYKPNKLIGLYRVNENHAFMRYRNTVKSGEYNRFLLDNWDNSGDNLLIENHIAERYLWERRNNHEYGSGKEWYRIRGGKYTYKTLDETLQYAKEWCSRPNRIKGGYICSSPELRSLKEEDVDRPLCKCGYPSEVKLSIDKTTIYFVCSLKSMTKSPFKLLQVPCDFYQQYMEDKEVKAQYEVVNVRSKESWVLNIPLSKYKIEPESCISCNKTGYLAIFNGGARRLCQPCIITKYTSLKEEYEDKCLIKLK